MTAPELPTVRLFGIDIHAVTLKLAIDTILSWVRVRDESLRYVVTPNVQHSLLFQDNHELQDAYRAASLVIVDGLPLVWSARAFGRPLPERVAGSDIVPALYASATRERPLTTYFLGGAPGVGERAARRVESDYPFTKVVGIDSPPLGFERDPELDAGVVERINKASPDVLLVGLGCPKQELWSRRHQQAVKAGAALCVGGTVHFLAGEKPRAPQWMRKVGVEWVHRIASDPKRLAPRYARDARDFPRLLLREWRSARSGSRSG